MTDDTSTTTARDGAERLDLRQGDDGAEPRPTALDIDALQPLRDAAAVLRTRPGATALETAIADWLDGEYVSHAEMEPFADLINAAFTAVSGNEVALLRFGRTDDGRVQLATDTSAGALAVAAQVLATRDGATGSDFELRA